MKKGYRFDKIRGSLEGMVFKTVHLLLLIFWTTLSLHSSAWAIQAGGQQETVSGQVIDSSTGEALPGVNVVIKGTLRGTTTDLEGFFSLEVPSLSDTLVFSFIGYETTEDPINGRNVIDITLTPSTVIGEELVVVGYGSVRQRDLTGSVVQLDQDIFNQGVNNSVDEMLRGKAPGVQVVQNSGEPGGGLSINIRGVGSINAGSSPLYVIDGLPISSMVISGTGNQIVQNRSQRDPLSSLNPEDIESIEILKDASATAIYGSRGANGVILITTKRGSAGDLEINYNGHFGIQNVHNRLDLLNAEQYMQEINSIIDSGNPGEWVPSERVDGIQSGGTDWQDVIFRENAPLQKHNLSFSWGNENTTYFISLNNTNQQGIVQESSYERYAARFNLNHSTDKFSVGINATTSYIRDEFVPYGFDVNLRGGVINSARQFDPTLTVRNEDGSFNLSPFDLLDNPVAITTGNHMDANRYRYFGTVYGEYSILPALSVKLNVGADADNQERRSYKDRTTILGNALGGVGTLYGGAQSNYLIEGTVRYNETISRNHQIDVVAGVTTQKFIHTSSTLQGEGFPSDATLANNFGLADPNSYVNNSNKSTNSLLSYLGRITYRFMDKYLFTGTYRVDGSSRFGEENRFGYFPSFSAGWLMDQEDFFPLKEVFSQFKLRGSWGQTGNQQIGNNQSVLTFGAGPNYVLNDQLVGTLAPERIANPELKWETTEQIDIGLDFSLLEDRISGSVDWYQKETFDMLLNLPVPTSTGFDNQRVNIGGMMNKGFEFSLTSHNISAQNLNWSTNINLTTLKNEVTDLGEISRIVSGNSIIEPGRPLRSYYGYEVSGIWQQNEAEEASVYGSEPGDFKFRDVNSDGTIDGEDRVMLGNSFPDMTWMLGNTFNYNSFQLFFSIEGVHGIDMLNQNLQETYFPSFSRRANKFAEPFLNRWTPENPTNEYPSFLNPGRQLGQNVNSKTIEDASYIKLQTVRLSYHVPGRVLSGLARSAEVYITGQNLLTLTDYQGFDPALNPNGNAHFRIDWNGYPSAKTYMIGINVGF